MAKPGLKNQEQQSLSAQKKHEAGESLRGSFASVMILGGFIIVSWALVFLLFIVRN